MNMLPPSSEAKYAGWEYVNRLSSHPTHFIPEDGDSMFLQNAGNTNCLHTVTTPKSMINIKISGIIC
jgi:hypothetical protein